MILTIESCADISTLGLFDDEYNFLHGVSYPSRNDMAQKMFDRLNFLLGEYDKSNLSAIITTIGPGSFTGVRIGVITAKMLAIELNIPIIGVSALTATASPIINFSGIVMPIINARRKELYYKMYRDGVEIHVESSGNIMNINETLNNIKKVGEVINIIGITNNLPEEFAELINNHNHICFETTPQAVLSSVKERLKNKDYDDAMTLNPIYLRSATDR